MHPRITRNFSTSWTDFERKIFRRTFYPKHTKTMRTKFVCFFIYYFIFFLLYSLFSLLLVTLLLSILFFMLLYNLRQTWSDAQPDKIKPRVLTLLSSFTYIRLTHILTYLLTYLFSYLLTYSMEQSPSSEANWFCS